MGSSLGAHIIIKLRHLHYFVKIVDAGSFSRAATMVYVAQPALSQQIAEVESELGVPLLHRSPRGVRPTEAGEIFYREATQILRRVERLPEMVRHSSKEIAGPVSLGMSSTLASFLAGEIIAYCKERFPQVTLSFVTEDSANLRTRLRAHSLDLALVFGEEPPALGLVHEPLFRQRLFLIEKRQPQAARRKVHLRQLAQQPLVMPSAGNPTRALLDTHFARVGVTPVLAADSNLLSGMISAVLSGVGAAIAPIGSFAGTPWEDSLSATPINPAMHQTAYAVWSEDAQATTANMAIRALIEHFARSLVELHAKSGMDAIAR